jgi:Uma2 family endonuclease
VTGPGAERPVVIVQVLSPSTAAYDLGDKAAAYRKLPSLRHLVLVSQDKVRVEHYHRSAEGADFVLTELDRIDDRLVLAAVGVEIVVADLYAQVTFTA